MAQQQNRQTAYKIRISDLVNGNFVKGDGWEPNYVVVNDLKVARVNLICAIVSKENAENHQSIIIDDGSAKISVRSFDEKITFDDFKIGDAVLLIARLREFNGEKYLTPEIIKKVENKKWIELRGLEFGEKKQKEVLIEEKIEDGVKGGPIDHTLKIIRKLDNGEGANFEDVINELKDEQLVAELLKQGEIFEPKPGKLKVLE